MKNALLKNDPESKKPVHSLRPTDASGCTSFEKILPCTESFWTLTGVLKPCEVCRPGINPARHTLGYMSIGAEFFFSPRHMDKSAISAARARNLSFAHYHDKWKANQP